MGVNCGGRVGARIPAPGSPCEAVSEAERACAATRYLRPCPLVTPVAARGSGTATPAVPLPLVRLRVAGRPRAFLILQRGVARLSPGCRDTCREALTCNPSRRHPRPCRDTGLRARRRIFGVRGACRTRRARQRPRLAVDVGDAAGTEAEPAAERSGHARVGPATVLPHRRRPFRRLGRLLGRLVLAANPAAAAAESAGQEQLAELVAATAAALRAGDRVSHARPDPLHVLQATHLDCFLLSPFWSIHSPPAPMHVLQTGGWSSSFFPTLRPYDGRSFLSARHICNPRVACFPRLRGVPIGAATRIRRVSRTGRPRRAPQRGSDVRVWGSPKL